MTKLISFCEHLKGELGVGSCGFIHDIEQQREELKFTHVPGVTIIVESLPQTFIPTGAKFTEGTWSDFWVCQLRRDGVGLETCSKWDPKINRGGGSGGTSHSC